MCLIAHRSNPGAHIPNDVIDYNLRINPDGFGLAWRDEKSDNIMYMKFAPSEKNLFRDKLKEIDKTKAEYVAHWRKATHGEMSAAMAHPFPYVDPSGRNILAFHNGIISIGTQGGESDTKAFVDRILSRLPFGWWKDHFMKYMVEDAIGWSRILLWVGNSIVKLNESSWKWENGIHYSTTPGPWNYSSKSGGTTYHSSTSVWDPQEKKWVPKTEPSKGSEIIKPTSALTVVKTTRESAFGEVEDDDDGLYVSRSTGLWYHKGHVVDKMGPPEERDPDDTDNPVEEYGTLMCSLCKTVGEYYKVMGTTFIDLVHTTGWTLRSSEFDSDDDLIGMYN